VNWSGGGLTACVCCKGKCGEFLFFFFFLSFFSCPHTKNAGRLDTADTTAYMGAAGHGKDGGHGSGSSAAVVQIDSDSDDCSPTSALPGHLSVLVPSDSSDADDNPDMDKDVTEIIDGDDDWEPEPAMLVNPWRESDEQDVFFPPEIAAIIKPHQVFPFPHVSLAKIRLQLGQGCWCAVHVDKHCRVCAKVLRDIWFRVHPCARHGSG
jgi:hypothetical protein